MIVEAHHAHYMREACRLTRDLVAKHPVKRDLIPEYEAVQAWPLVAPLYTGIEQALKMLLLAPSDTCFTLGQLKRDYGHNLEKLYAELSADDRDHIELHFREHWNLYGYNTYGADINTAEQFITQINGPSQDGFLAWRYLLIDETMKLPTTSPLAMSEIWQAICCRIRRKILNKTDDCSSLSRRLMWGFNRRFPTLVPYEAFNGDMRTWMLHKGGSPLAAWIDLLVKAHGDAIHEVQAPDELRPVLADVADRALKKMASDSADPDESMLLHRIQADPNLVWDPSDGVFR